MHLDQEILDQLVDRIVKAVHPIRIYLFGSAVRDEMTPGSDIDLLIVMPEGTHRRHASQLLHRKLSGIGVPFDILVATPGDLRKHRHNIGLIYRSVLQEGKEIYAA